MKMKKIILSIISVFAISIAVKAQTTLISQSFENDSLTGWSYSTDPAPFNVGSDKWDTLKTLSTNLTTMPSDSSYFWGVQDLANGNGGTATGDSGTISFNYYTLPSTATNVAITFDYDVSGFDTGDDVEYEVFENNVSKGIMSLVAGGVGGVSQKGNAAITIAASTDSVAIKIYVTQNGGTDYAGFDNFKVVSGYVPPAPKTIPSYTIGTITADDMNGVSDSDGVECKIRGVVYGMNIGGSSATQFVMIDNTGGIVVRKSGGFTPAYTVREGDSVDVWGKVDNYRGLTQFNADSMKVLSANGTVKMPLKIAKPDASTESEYIRIDSVTIVGGTWPTPGNSANIDVETPAKDTITLRIDRNTEVDDSVSAPTGMFSIIGFGGQFDFSSPYTSGYQIQPHFKRHIELPPATCNDPSMLTAVQTSATSVRLIWSSNSSLSNLEYGAQGFTQGSGTMITAQTSPYNIMNLTTGNSYDVYYQDTCATVGTSNWVGPVTFTLSASPKISAIWRTSSTNIMVAYTDSMQSLVATSTSRYKGITNLSSVTLNSSADTATLNYSAPFADGIMNTLTVDSVLSASLALLDTVYTFSFVYNGSTPNIVINEIMYNDQSGPDTLEYLELHNAGATAAAVGGMEFTSGITMTIPAGVTMAPGSYLVLARNAAAHSTVFANSIVTEWTGGGLSNSGETIEISNSDGTVIDVVSYDDGNGWPIEADGNGYALVLCDPASDNNAASSWGLEPATFRSSGYFGSPGVANICRPPVVYQTYPISTVRTVDSDGEADSNGVKCYLHGVVITPSYRGVGRGYEFHMNDNSSPLNGINVINFSGSDYVPRVGDSVKVFGLIDTYNGHVQIKTEQDSIWVLDSNRTVPMPMPVSKLDETTESKLLRMDQWEIIDTTGWPTSNFGNYDITNGTDTVTMRMDGDRDWRNKMPIPPLGKFCFIGVGGQFDRTTPHFEGYQISPRDTNDFIMCPMPCPMPTEIAISDTTNEGGTVTWTSNGGNWNIGWAKGHSSTKPADSVMNIITKSYVLTGLDSNAHYHVWVQEVCSGNNKSEWAGPIMFNTLEFPAGVVEFNGSIPLVIFPNPNSNGKLRLNKVTSVVIRNLLGQPVIEAVETDEIDINALVKGVYLIEAAEGETQKLIVE